MELVTLNESVQPCRIVIMEKTGGPQHYRLVDAHVRVVGLHSVLETSGVEIGAVDEDLIVDSLLINASGRLDKPERFEPALQSS